MILVNQMHLVFVLNAKNITVIHALNIIMKKLNHKMEKLDIYVPIDLYCQSHPDNLLNLFCADEKGK